VYRPLDERELQDLAGTLARPLSDAPSVRATGTGQMTFSGRTLRFGFALLQSGPSWLRIDLRPDIMGFGAGFNALILVEGACARAYFPARVTEIRGCFDEIFGFPAIEGAASLATGFPDSSLVAALKGAALADEGDELALRGTLNGTPADIRVARELGVVTRILAGEPGSFEDVRIEYGGHGWKEALPCPRTINVVAREGTSREARLRLEFETFRVAGAIDAETHGIPVLPGARVLTWSDVFDGRE
jgi:hypothetical protein